MDDASIKKIFDFISQQKLMVISTMGEEKPESAVVAFAETEHLEIIFATSNMTRKYSNLGKNSHVACVIGWDYDIATTVQYEGVAKELAGDDAKKYSSMLFAKHPGSARHASSPDERYFVITPTWVRYTNYSAKPSELLEIRDF